MQIRFVSVIAAVSLLLCIAACKPDRNNDLPVPDAPPVNDITTVTASITGMVMNENNAPAIGAKVVAGGQTTTTNQYGVFRFSNIVVSQANAAVRVSLNGYFTHYRTFIATAGRNHTVRIKLLPKTNAGNFTASAGGSLQLPNGAQLTIPANAITDTLGAAYNGVVNVAMTWINPTANDFAAALPGDLRGVTTEGRERALESYGMTGVLLTGTGGKPLRIVPGKQAGLVFPIPATLQASAPATIPLWYFDEISARWKQEGSATKNGTTYTASVSHFSFWNCDAPFPVVNLCMRIVNSANNQPAVNIQVRIRRVNAASGSMVTTGYTDAEGNLCGGVPQNEALVLEVISNCGTILHTQNIGPFSTSSSLGTITINMTPANLVVFTGQLVNCSNNPVASGQVVIFLSGGQLVPAAVVNGTFAASFIHCNSGPVNYNYSVIGVDYSNQLQSSTLAGNVSTAGTVNLGTISACASNTTQFIDITIDGVPYSWSPPDSLSNTVGYFGIDSYTSHYDGIKNGGTQPYRVSFGFSSVLGYPSPHPLGSFNINVPGALAVNLVSGVPANLFFTVSGIYPNVYETGQFTVQANFTTPPLVRTVTCQYRVRQGQ